MFYALPCGKSQLILRIFTTPPGGSLTVKKQRVFRTRDSRNWWPVVLKHSEWQTTSRTESQFCFGITAAAPHSTIAGHKKRTFTPCLNVLDGGQGSVFTWLCESFVSLE